MDKKRVAVTGLGVIAPNGTNVDEFWKNMRVGKSGIARIETFDVDAFQSRIAGIVQDFSPDDYDIDDDQKHGLDRFALFALAAAEEAMRNAGLREGDYDPDRLAVSIATAIAGTKYMEEEFLRLTQGGSAPLDAALASPDLLPNTCFHIASSEIARKYGARGPVHTLATGCTAGLDAVGEAMEMIRAGEADIVIAGAAEAPLTPIALGAFDIIGALPDDRNHRPDTASRPYDVSRSGFVLAEGCGILVLEDLDHARRRGAPILAELRGFGSTCNAYHMTDLQPEGIDLHRAMVLALADAGLDPGRIDYVNAHGSSTPQNDVNETNAVKRTLGARAHEIPVCSLKSIVGHALAGANTVELVSLVQTILHQETPPTANLVTPDPACDLDYVADGPRKTRIDFAMKDASGFSGIHSALIVARYDPTASHSEEARLA
ncbi:beta-ketoacyl-[acyl-carrier-protein] synthase family protein [Roseospira visakhapatnamensis]|uniref:3-oxoacyl-(Acyl-carrier-protein) synthase n=1 Tax=Roseospira visakhapatnamensis TaxID=390880 RepID=A0A7W6WAH7_9PROT|nr:beta-ketoacyl-[acyl-carrier-protein] synthase family protein [Roseospira visakhapatnamensis]MBB4266507.1 3-oxoacyl-(acyl-carrier-protein) synthase [Roseospira visakhapatnamensis]